MNRSRLSTLFGFLVVLAMLLSACGGSATEAPAEPEAPAATEAATEAPAATEAAALGPVTVWSKFNDASPQNAQDEWMKAMIEGFAADTGVEATNVVQPYDQINAKLNLAVQAGGDVPDVSYVDSQFIGFYYQNGTLTDITDYVKSAPWYDDINQAALAMCTGPDGKIYCVPTGTQNRMTYYWTDDFPNGFPTDTDAFLVEAARLKAEGKYAITFKGSESYAADVFYFSLVRSFGGRYGDETGKATWASPETVKAVEFFRTLFAEGYVPEVALAAGFDYENPFKDGTAASFSAGSWSYVWLNPITAPDGTAFDAGPASVEDALKAGKLGIAPPLAAPGGEPVTSVNGTAWAIPAGAANLEGAYEFINYQMETQRNADFAYGYGTVPTLNSALADPRFADSPYWQAVIENLNNYGQANDPLVDFDKAMVKFSDTVVKLIQDPSLDILTELQAAQDEINAGQ